MARLLAYLVAMPGKLEPVIRELARAANFGVLSFHLPSGQLAGHVMWVDATDDQLLINTEVHRAKYKAMQQNPNVSVTIWDRENPYRYAEVRGRVIGEVRGDEARSHIDDVSRKYLGHEYQAPIQSERVIVRIDPVRQITRGV
jgi:PPOX class probable F420-dependent enzyme